MPAVMALFPHDAGVGGGAAAANPRKANQACYSCRKQVSQYTYIPTYMAASCVEPFVWYRRRMLTLAAEAQMRQGFARVFLMLENGTAL